MSLELLYLELLMSENIGIPRPPKRTGNDSNFHSADEVVRGTSEKYVRKGGGGGGGVPRKSMHAYKGEGGGGLIFDILVRTYYVNDPLLLLY